MTKLILAACILAAVLPLSQAQTAGSWTVSVQQGGNTFGHSATATLKKAPFTLVFEGAKDLGYAVIASTGCEQLQGLKTPAEIFEHTNPMAAAAETPNRADNTWLNVNTSAHLKSKNNSWNNWGDDVEDQLFSFQKFFPSTAGKYIGQREIKEIYVSGTPKESGIIAIEKYTGNQICMLVTGLPPVGHLAHVEPKLVRISFQ